jgi:class 3 adenylate cyclase
MNSEETSREPATPALMFADVTDSSRLYATYGDTEARRIVGGCLAFMESVVTDGGGRVIKTIGDEIMCLFPSANAAALAAIQLNVLLRARAASGELHSSLTLRIGFHAGPVVEEKGDVFGDTVNLAARMASLSKAHQVMTTRQTIERLDPSMRPLARFVDQSMIKGQTQEFDLYEILWDMEEATQATLRARASVPETAISLQVSRGGQSWVVDREHATLTFGRSAQCQVVLDDTRVSRLHARLEYQRDKILLKDVSTNGTHVALEDGGKRLVRRDELALASSGLLCLGREIDPDSPAVFRLIYRKGAARL